MADTLTLDPGTFVRALPPKSRRPDCNLEFELGIEVVRWFHYRHGKWVGINLIDGPQRCRQVLEQEYKTIICGMAGGGKNFDAMWVTLKPYVAEPHIKEFFDTYRDVLAEIELTK